jgi:hypothetical protein
MVAIHKGDRVAIAPHSDIFMMGERFGEVTSIGTKWIHVRGERSGKSFRFFKGGDSLETTAAPIAVNLEQSLYVIRSGDGYTCLGFDICGDRARKYLDWLMSRGEPDAGGLLSEFDRLPRGELRKYEIYRAACDAIKARYDRTRERCEVDLVPQLIGLEGKRVEVVDSYGERRRFTVGKSSGWIPVHLELEPRANGGSPAYGAPYQSVRAI